MKTGRGFRSGGFINPSHYLLLLHLGLEFGHNFTVANVRSITPIAPGLPSYNSYVAAEFTSTKQAEQYARASAVNAIYCFRLYEPVSHCYCWSAHGNHQGIWRAANHERFGYSKFTKLRLGYVGCSRSDLGRTSNRIGVRRQYHLQVVSK